MGVGFAARAMDSDTAQRIWRGQWQWLVIATPLLGGDAIIRLTEGWARWLGFALIIGAGLGWSWVRQSVYREGAQDAFNGVLSEALARVGLLSCDASPSLVVAGFLGRLPADAVVYHHAADESVIGRVEHVGGEFVEPLMLLRGEGLRVEIFDPADWPLDLGLKLVVPESADAGKRRWA
jgi:hypothetical protein